MKNIPYPQLQACGEFCRRAEANFDRLESLEYDPAHLYKDGDYSWPGDWEGRTLLAWTLLAQVTGQQPKYMEEAQRLLPSKLNEKGFFGPVHPIGTVDEQQLSGNSWFLRAVCEYYRWTRNDRALTVIHDVIDHLLLPAAGYYSQYPVLPEQRTYEGEAIGELQGKVGAWHLSTDIGCAFIMLDGATQAYQIVQKPELKALIEEMIDKFMTIDIVRLSFQTHATLSALRGLLRHYETTGDAKLLQKVVQTFDLYLEQGMTENYANYNWFGRPEWTEPCAVVDSFLIAVGLWQHTGNVAYLNAAHHIFYNGLGYGQRANGGFGCDVCAGVHDEMLAPKEGLFEAYWCCTMRGAEGLSRAIECCYFVWNKDVIIPFYENSNATIAFHDGELVLVQKTKYPLAGNTQFEVQENTCRQPVTLRFFIPSWVEHSSVLLRMNGEPVEAVVQNGFVAVSGRFPQGTAIELSFVIGLRKEKAFGYHTSINGYSYRHGALLLGIDNPDNAVSIKQDETIVPLGDGMYRLVSSNGLLAPVNNMMDIAFHESVHNRKQVLFRE